MTTKEFFKSLLLFLIFYFLVTLISVVLIKIMDFENVYLITLAVGQTAMFSGIIYYLIKYRLININQLFSTNLALFKDTKFIILCISAFILLLIVNNSFIQFQSLLIPDYFKSEYIQSLEDMNNNISKILADDSYLSYLIAISVAALIPALGEEVLFRGYWLDKLSINYSAKYSIMLTGLIFAIIHFNYIALFPLFLFGIFLGIIFYITKNILFPIILHFLNNAAAIFENKINGSDNSAIELLKSDLTYSELLIELSTYLLIVAVGIVVIYLILKYLSNHANNLTANR